MLSPSVCRLTLALPVFCRCKSSPIFPCTSLEIGNKSAASAERSSKSPSSLFLALENGHSPDIFSSFSFAQNIFPNVLFFGFLLSHFGGWQSWSSGCEIWVKFHHLLRSSKTPFPLATRRFKWSAPKPRITYNIHWNLHGQTMAVG